MLFVGIGFSFVFKHSSSGDPSLREGFHGGIIYYICMMYVIMGGLDYSIHSCIFLLLYISLYLGEAFSHEVFHFSPFSERLHCISFVHGYLTWPSS